MANVNRVVVSGNLTRDPELRQLAGGNSVCKLRIAVNTRKKDRDTNNGNAEENDPNDQIRILHLSILEAERRSAEQ